MAITHSFDHMIRDYSVCSGVAMREGLNLGSAFAAGVQLPICMCSWKDSVDLACRLCGLVLQGNLDQLFPVLMICDTSRPPEGMKHVVIVCCYGV